MVLDWLCTLCLLQGYVDPLESRAAEADLDSDAVPVLRGADQCGVCWRRSIRILHENGLAIHVDREAIVAVYDGAAGGGMQAAKVGWVQARLRFG